MKSLTPLRFLLTIALTLVLLPMLVVPAHATDSDGTPDTTFNANTGTGFSDGVISVAMQANGQIVVGGGFTTLNGVTANGIARLNADGTPDTAFTTNIGTGFNGRVDGVAVQADGKIVVVGSSTLLNGVPVSRGIARLNADGTLDTAFSANTGTGFDSFAIAVAVQADGKIVVGGQFTTLNGARAENVVRLNADGTRDTAFTADRRDGFGSGSQVRAVAVQADGKIVVGGRFIRRRTPDRNLLRLNADGTPDTTFNANTGTGFNDLLESVAVQADGKIVVGGRFTALDGATVNRIARLNADGTPDAAFNANTGTGLNNFVFAVAVQADGKIVVGGAFTTLNGVTVNRIARLNANGTTDTAFNANTGTGFNNTVVAVAVQADGKIVVGGGFTTLNSVTGVNRIARFGRSITPTDPSITPTDPPTWTTYRQALPMPASGFCSDITAEQNSLAAYNTGVTGDWVKAWEPWVNETLDANGERIGGWACWRNLVNTGGNNWRTTSTP